MMLMSGMNSAMTIVPTIKASKNNHDRLEQGGQTFHRVVHFVVVNLRNLQKHLGQLSGLLTDVDHPDHHRWKDAARLQRLDDRFPFLDAVMHLVTASATTLLPAVSRVIFSACKIGTPLVTSVPSVRLKTRDGTLPDQIAEERRASLIRSMNRPAGAEREPEDDESPRRAAPSSIGPVILHEDRSPR